MIKEILAVLEKWPKKADRVFKNNYSSLLYEMSVITDRFNPRCNTERAYIIIKHIKVKPVCTKCDNPAWFVSYETGYDIHCKEHYKRKPKRRLPSTETGKSK